MFRKRRITEQIDEEELKDKVEEILDDEWEDFLDDVERALKETERDIDVYEFMEYVSDRELDLDDDTDRRIFAEYVRERFESIFRRYLKL